MGLLTNNIADCEILNLETGPNRRGPYVVRQDGVAPRGTSVRSYRFLLRNATLGYGDLVLPKDWRLFGPLEALIGTLMCGLSVAFFFGVLAKQFLKRFDAMEPSLADS